jgi:glycosyltransferase involved in cell wall biosynthesis
MLAAYTHPSCKAILFLTEQGVAEAYQWLGTVTNAGVRRAFLERCHVVPAAHRTLDSNEVRRKWRDDPTTVVFCGRDYYQKNGRLALVVMTSMARRFPEALFHYVGATPDNSLTRGVGALPNATLHGPLPRAKALGVIAASHVLFHPARYESFGMVYAEAMAAGLAIISSAGPQMEHVDELLDTGGARLVRRSGDFDRDRVAFTRMLQQLLERRSDAAAMGAANYRWATSGALSIRRRNALLKKIYERAEAGIAEPLSIADLGPDSADLVRLSAGQVVEDFREFRRASPRAPVSVLLASPAMIA